jgi:hypothetical protein
MWSNNWFRNGLNPARSRPISQRRPPRRQQRRALRRVPLGLENLEDRITPNGGHPLPPTVINVNDITGFMDNPATVTVSSLGSKVTLIDAINAANNTSATAGGSYTISLPANRLITLAQPLNNTTVSGKNVVQDQNWYGPDALPAITSNIIIQGNGATLEPYADANMRFFYVSGGPSLTGGALPLGTLELDDLTLEGGTAQGGNGSGGGGGGLGAGGAIFNQGNLTLNGVTLTDNTAIGGNGSAGTSIRAAGGGGMSSNADSSGNGGGFGGNFSSPGGGGGGGGYGGGGGGGAGFQADDHGGPGISTIGGAGGGLGGFGGAGGAGDSLSGAAGDGGGGGASSPPGSGGGGGGLGDGGVFGSAGAGGSGGGIGGGGGGSSGGGGGGGFGGGGGGAGSELGGDGGFGGGGGGADHPGAGGFGGGQGAVTNASVGISALTATGGGGAGMGGGIFNMFGTLTILNATLSGNSAQGGNGSGQAGGGSGYGGAIFNLDGNATLTYTTIANNSVSHGANGVNPARDGNADGGGVYNLAYGNTLGGKGNTAILTLNNSVIGQNENYGLSHDLVNDAENGKNTNTALVNGSSSVVQGGSILTGNGTNLLAPGAITVTSAPNLATALASNFGSVETLAPNSGSPVLGAGNADIPGLPSVDQNGQPRPASNPDDGAVQTQSTTSTRITTLSASSTYNSSTPQTVTLSALVSSGGHTVNEGSVTFAVAGTSLTATGFVNNGAATATLTLPAGFSAGNYSFSASYSDSNGAYGPSTAATNGTLLVNPATVTTTPLNIANTINSHPQMVTLAANVSSANSSTVNEGAVTFTLIDPNGSNLTAIGSVTNGTAAATLTLPLHFVPGTYVYTASYADSNNANGVSNFAPSGGAATADPPAASVTLTADNPSAGNPPTGSSAAAPPVGPVGGLSVFAIGVGPTGIDLFEVDSQGDVFAQSLFGGGLQLLNTSLQLPFAMMSNEGLLALLAGDNGQNYYIDLFDPFLPLIEPEVLAALD